MKLPKDMDKEVVNLCNAINSVDKSIRTVGSCSGHGKDPLRIWVKASILKVLPKLLYWFDGCHSGEYGWVVSIGTDCGMQFPTLCVGSTDKGKKAYKAASHIARCMKAQEYVD